MRIIALLCSCLLLATLFGAARPTASPQSLWSAVHVVAPLADAPCKNEASQGNCQFAVADQISLAGLMPPGTLPRFEVGPDAASSRSPPPRTPPPRLIF